MSDDDDVSSFVSSLAILLTVIGGMILITSDSKTGGEPFDADFLGYFLIVVMVGTIVFQLTMTFLNTTIGSRLRARACRKKLSENAPSGESASDGGAKVKVTPVSAPRPRPADTRPAAAAATPKTQAPSESKRDAKPNLFVYDL